MADTAVEKEATPVKAPAADKKRGRPAAAKKPAAEKKPKAPKEKKPKAPAVKKLATHPSAAIMVVEAVGKLNEKGGSSLRAIKKYITEVHKADTEKIAHFIRKALKKAVTDGKLVQTKGTGAAGSFKLPVKGGAVAKPKKAASGVKKPKVTKKPSSPKPKAAKKPASPKKAGAAKKAKKPAAKKAKSPAAKKAPASPVKKAEAPAAPAAAAAPAPAKAAPAPKKAAAPKTAKAKAPKTLKAKPAAKPKTGAKKTAPKKK